MPKKSTKLWGIKKQQKATPTKRVRKTTPKSTKTTPHKYRVNDRVVARALLKAFGNITVAADYLGMNRGYISRRVNASVFLKGKQIEGGELFNDAAENKLHDLVGEGHFPAVRFTLLTKGRSRGYSLVPGEDGTPVVPAVTNNTYNTQINYTREERKKLKDEYEERAKQYLGLAAVPSLKES